MFLQIEYANAPRIAIPEPMAPSLDTGLRNTNTDARMITTRFTVFFGSDGRIEYTLVRIQCESGKEHLKPYSASYQTQINLP